MKTHIRHIEQAEAENFTIDRSAAGRPVGYKGPRHQPKEWCDCYTELETTLMHDRISIEEAVALVQKEVDSWVLKNGEHLRGAMKRTLERALRGPR